MCVLVTQVAVSCGRNGDGRSALMYDAPEALGSRVRPGRWTKQPRVLLVADENISKNHLKLKALRTKCNPHLKTSEELKNALVEQRRTFGTTVVVTKSDNNTNHE